MDAFPLMHSESGTVTIKHVYLHVKSILGNLCSRNGAVAWVMNSLNIQGAHSSRYFGGHPDTHTHTHTHTYSKPPNLGTFSVT